jgi:hypothetical protein
MELEIAESGFSCGLLHAFPENLLDFFQRLTVPYHLAVYDNGWNIFNTVILFEDMQHAAFIVVGENEKPEFFSILPVQLVEKVFIGDTGQAF